MASCGELKAFWRVYVFLLTPLLLLPLPLVVDGPESACGYAILVMAVYWLTEALPFAVTALLPMVLFPLMGLVPASTVSLNYMRDINFVFIGGIMVALSVEKSNLHSRISLRLLQTMGVKPRWLVLGFMLSTWFLSMWICNTATTVMMLPVATAVLEQFKTSASQEKIGYHAPEQSGDTAVVNIHVEDACACTTGAKERNAHVNPTLLESVHLEAGDIEVTRFAGESPEVLLDCSCSSQSRELATQPDNVSVIGVKAPEVHERLAAKHAMMSKLFGLAVCYSANIGGVATLTGQSPNLVFAGFVELLWASHGLPSPINWSSWFIFAFPLAVFCLAIAWILLILFFLGPKDLCFCCSKEEHDPEMERKIVETVDRQYKELGPMRFDEKASLICLVSLVLLWFLRDPGFVSGYAVWFEPGYVGDSVPAVFIGVLLFIIPERRPISKFFCNLKRGEVPVSVPALLNWPLVSRRMAWGPILIVGAGFAMAQAVQVSGLSAVIAEALDGLGNMPSPVLILSITIVVGILTNITSNAATVSLILPILAAMADGLHMNPLYLMLPATVSSTMSFSLPVATPPNSVAFANGYVKVLDMAKIGTVLHLLCILVILIATHTWGMALFDLDTVPWDSGNTTVSHP